MKLNEATVLIVDDEIPLLRIYERWFQNEECRVLTATNGLEALALLDAQPVHMIVSDVRMPRMDGFAMAKRIQHMAGYYPKIIFISGFSEVTDRDCYGLGVEAVLAKPFKRQALIEMVTRSLTSRDLLWQEQPLTTPALSVHASFDSLRGAIDQGLIAFGHGGVCIDSLLQFPVGDAVTLDIAFTADHHALSGQGIIRWIAGDEHQIGIEITHIGDTDRSWAADLAEHNETVSFIPIHSQTLRHA